MIDSSSSSSSRRRSARARGQGRRSMKRVARAQGRAFLTRRAFTCNLALRSPLGRGRRMTTPHRSMKTHD